MQSITLLKANGKQVYVQTNDDLAVDAWRQLCGRQRSSSARRARLAEAGAPAIYQMRDLTMGPADNPQWQKWHQSRERLRGWLFARLRITDEMIENTPGCSGQFSPTLSTLRAVS